MSDISSEKDKILVIIPAYNEGLVLGSLVLSALKYASKVIVVNDGSSDNTEEIATLAGAEVITMKKNGGKAKAMMAGFSRARELGFPATVMLDGDGQHKTEDIPRIAAPVLAEDADLVVGSRFLQPDGEEEIPGYRRFGQRVLNEATNISSSVRCSDSQSGYRAISRAGLDNMDFPTSGYGIESDMLAHFAERGLKIVEIPISVTYDVPHKHKMNPVKHGLSVLSGILQLFTVKHPLFCFGIPGLIFVGVGTYLAVEALMIVARTNVWPPTTTLGAAMLMMMGMLLISVSLILFSISKLVKRG